MLSIYHSLIILQNVVVQDECENGKLLVAIKSFNFLYYTPYINSIPDIKHCLYRYVSTHHLSNEQDMSFLLLD